MPTMEGTYLPNPFISIPLIKDLKRGTVHPFGGCCLADSAAKGGCNHKGQVFSGEAGTDVYDSLLVCDGATVPTSLGVNPLWTISAIAERAIAYLMEDKGWGSTVAETSPSAADKAAEKAAVAAPPAFGSAFTAGHGSVPLGGGGGGGGGSASVHAKLPEW